MTIQLITYITAAYLIILGIVAPLTGNREFTLYTIVLGMIMLIVIHQRTMLAVNFKFSRRVLASLSILGFLGLSGGIIQFRGDRLLNFVLIEGWLRYQDILHIAFMFVMVLVSYIFLRPYMYGGRLAHVRHGHLFLNIGVVLMVTGVGAFIEVIELAAVVFLGAGDTVGGYLPNATDLFLNLIGATLGALFLPFKPEDEPEVDGS